MSGYQEITAGFLPLLDSAVLVAAKECGFDIKQDINLTLVRESSWANIRDRMAVGHFNAAHMLAPMPIAANLGLTAMPVDLIAPMALGLGGNAITVSEALWQQIAEEGGQKNADPKEVGAALHKVIQARSKTQSHPLRFGVVHPHSGHNLELRYWLSACHIDPDQDVEIVVVPPPLMPDAIGSGALDAYCVGEPWNSVAVAKGYAHIATVKAAIWRSSPEKVLALRLGWTKDNEALAMALIRALYHAAQWCGQIENHKDLATILSSEHYLNVAPDVILRGLTGQLDLGGGKQIVIDNFFQPFEPAATFPWQSHALWFYSQLVRWGMVTHSSDNVERARHSYRPDLYRNALVSEGGSLPSSNAKVEGALSESTPFGATHGTVVLGPDGFFDGRVFDPDQLEDYLAQTV